LHIFSSIDRLWGLLEGQKKARQEGWRRTYDNTSDIIDDAQATIWAIFFYLTISPAQMWGQ
jgi:hypothetical protein